MPAGRVRYRAVLARSGSVLLGVLLGIYAGELVLRACLFFSRGRGLDAVVARVGRPKKGANLGWGPIGGIIRPSRNPKIVYELQPGLDGYFLGKPLVTNEWGWRGQAYPKEKAAGSLRVIGLGDSHMFGWGVREEETFLRVVETLGQAQLPRWKWEAINTAVPGYNTVMEVETLAEKAAAFHPDIVVLDYQSNDLELPDFLYEPPNPFSLHQLYLASFLFSPMQWRVAREGRFDTLDALRIDPRSDRVPEAYRPLYGLNGFEDALQELKRLQDVHHFSTLVHITHDYPVGMAAHLLKRSEELGFRAFFHPQIDRLEYWVSQADHHPSALAHREKGEAIFRQLRELVGSGHS